ncbi:putative flagellar protein FliS [Lentilactobacillus parafarraginis F0439]|uniref:Putative flagellar protein FliS n=1 Tax=Lentilactobacillus parafarraginis F0439 TaxID=797515 RepID=G9ZT67_9LACO|nr:hypothetical protein [Lentilactobacillus parafarraginis]EHL95523.1 putative flagellar protein FliS [Lentilactobacillus parafarraginis F0439]
MLGKKKDVKSFIIENGPFVYISDQHKKVMTEISTIDRKYELYSYQYLNESYYQETIMMICLSFLLSSLQNDEKLSVKKLQINDTLIYNNEYYLFRGKDNEGNCVLKHVTRSKYPLMLSLPISLLESHAHKTRSAKKRKAKNSLKEFAKLFNVQLKGLVENKQIAILLPKKMLNELANSAFAIDKKTIYFGEVCPSVYLAAGGTVQSVLHSDSTESPFIVFSSNINELINYLDQGMARFEKIYVFGDNWFSQSNFRSTISLRNLAKEFGFSLGIFSSSNAIFESDSVQMLINLDYNRNWLFEYDEQVLLKSVHTNQQFELTMNSLIDFLRESKEDPKYRYFTNLIWDTLRIGSSVASINSAVFHKSITKIQDYVGFHKELDSIKTLDNLNSLLTNRFGAQVKKSLLRIVEKFPNCVLVVLDDLKQEYESIFKCLNIGVLSFRDSITEDMYDQFDTIILINPYTHERQKWTQAFLGSNVVVVTPEIFLKPLRRSVEKELKLAKILISESSQETSRYSYVKSLGLFLQSIKNRIKGTSHKSDSSYENSNERELAHEFENNENEVISDDEIYRRQINARANEFTQNNVDNTKVDVHKILELTNGFKMYGTDNAQVFTVSDNDTLVRKSINSVEIDDKIIYFNIPYSDSLYRMRFKKMSKAEVTPQGIDEANDFMWKRAFLDYIQRHGYTPMRLKDKMEALGSAMHTISYYAIWSNENKMPILPREPLFIRYVGKLIGSKRITDDYQEFYNSSEKVKHQLADYRDAELSGLNNKQLSKVQFKNYSVGKVTLIKEVDIPDVPRFMTNIPVKG